MTTKMPLHQRQRRLVLRPVVTGYRFFHLFAETLYVSFVPASDHLGITCIYPQLKKGEENGEPSDLTFFGTQKVETFFLTFFGSPTSL